MSHTALQFLENSILFDDPSIGKSYTNLTDHQLEQAVLDYRTHIIDHWNEHEGENQVNNDELSILFDSSLASPPPIQLLKQCALYYDRAILADPIFHLSYKSLPKSDSHKVIEGYLGFNEISIDRKRLSEVISYVKQVSPFVYGGFINFAPLSLAAEPIIDTLPVTYSPHLHADGLPFEVVDFFHSRARVYPLKKHSDRSGWFIANKAPLNPCRAIAVKFEGSEQIAMYFLFKIDEFSTEGEHFKVTQTLPDSPPSIDQFNTWVTQSINQAGRTQLIQASQELVQATKQNSMLLTQSEFISSLLSIQLGLDSNLESELAQLALRLDIPLLPELSIADLMSIRLQDGDAFVNFRVALRKGLRELRYIKNPDALRARLEDTQHELMEVQVREVDRMVKRIRKEFAYEALVALISLAAMIPTGGMSLAGLALVSATAYKTATVSYMNLKEHPSYFLWRLKQASAN